jgi:hypothetical protein
MVCLDRLHLSRLVRVATVAAGIAVLAGLSPPGRALAQQAADSRSNLESLTIKTKTGTHGFQVEVMRTDAERERGLMFRRYLPQNRGMLFDFKTVQPVMMWMKNTYIPLDMIFMARDGKVTNIARNAEPFSERIISSGPPAYAVLEVDAGTADKIGVAVGDRVQQTLFK